MANYFTRKVDRFFKTNAFLIEKEINYSQTVTMVNLIDLSALEIKKKLYSRTPIGYTAVVAKAVSIALKEFPEFNKRLYRPFGVFPYREQVFRNVDVSVAVEVKEKKYSHVAYIEIIENAESKDVVQLSGELNKIRNSHDSLQWNNYKKVATQIPSFLGTWISHFAYWIPSFWSKYRGGSVLISSPAKYGVDSIMTSWPAPIGISFGLVKDRPIVDNKQIRIAPTFYLTLNFDRRLLTGAQGAILMNRISKIIENCEVLGDLSPNYITVNRSL